MTLAHEAGSLSAFFTEYKKGDVMQDIFLDLIIQDVTDEDYQQDWAKEYIKVRSDFILKARQTEWGY